MLLTDGPPETYALIMIVILAAIIPVFMGYIAIIIYRLLKSVVITSEDNSASDKYRNTSFFSCLFTGWVICGPLFYYLYGFSH